jgi:hypothetical protein
VCGNSVCMIEARPVCRCRFWWWRRTRCRLESLAPKLNGRDALGSSTVLGIPAVGEDMRWTKSSKGEFDWVERAGSRYDFP